MAEESELKFPLFREEIKQEFRQLRRGMRREEESKLAKPEEPVPEEKAGSSEVLLEYKKDREQYEEHKKQRPAKGETQALLLEILQPS